MSLFVPKEWKDRLAEFAGRRKLTNISTGEETTVDVSRAEGEVSQEGHAFSAANMNDLEQRIKDGFDKVDADLGGFKPVIDETGKITGYTTKVGADTVFPFNNSQELLESIEYFYTGNNGTYTYTTSITDLDANKVYYFLLQGLVGITTPPYVSSISDGGISTVIPIPGYLINSPRFIKVENATSVVFTTVLGAKNGGVNIFRFTIQ